MPHLGFPEELFPFGVPGLVRCGWDWCHLLVRPRTWEMKCTRREHAGEHLTVSSLCASTHFCGLVFFQFLHHISNVFWLPETLNHKISGLQWLFLWPSYLLPESPFCHRNSEQESWCFPQQVSHQENVWVLKRWWFHSKLVNSMSKQSSVCNPVR